MQFDWKSYFVFTSKEQKGIIVLGCILSLSLLLHYLLPTTSSNEYLTIFGLSDTNSNAYDSTPSNNKSYIDDKFFINYNLFDYVHIFLRC